MKKIGLLSDTHSYLNPTIMEHFEDCDEIWHAGDIGQSDIVHRLSSFKPFKGVYGNIDGQEIRALCPEIAYFTCEEIRALMIHIGGYPGKYPLKVRKMLSEKPTDLFICGHSHILKVMYDKQFNFLHMNPGAAGKEGIHRVSTLLRFSISGKQIHDLEIVEMKKITPLNVTGIKAKK